MEDWIYDYIDYSDLIDANYGNVNKAIPIRLKVRVQEGLAQAYHKESDGSQVFLMCKSGLEMLLGTSLREREEIEIEVTGRLIGPTKFGV